MKQLKHEQQDKKNLASRKNEIDYLTLTISYDIDVYDCTRYDLKHAGCNKTRA